jgi:hypothetical protein
MTPGAIAQIKENWRHCYRKPGTSVAGVVREISESGAVARIHFDQVADSYILVSHLEPVGAEAALEPGLLSAA